MESKLMDDGFLEINIDDTLGAGEMHHDDKLFLPMEEVNQRYKDFTKKHFRKDGHYYKASKKRIEFLEANVVEKTLYTKKDLSILWDEFIQKERLGFLNKNQIVSMDDILNIGPDKFFYTLGFKKRSDVKSWRKNTVRIGKCCHCNNNFVPMLLSKNLGMCKNCRPKFSFESVQGFISEVVMNSDAYVKSNTKGLMDFCILFYNDKNLRALFLRKNPEHKKWIKKNS